MRYLTLNEVLALHGQVMAQSGGAVGVLSLPALESALAQPRMTFGGEDLYPTLVDKAAARCDYIITYNQQDFSGAEKFDIRVIGPRPFLQEIGALL